MAATKGPWEVEPRKYMRQTLQIRPKGSALLVAQAMPINHALDQDDEQDANARLIAAAPELLEAIQLAADAIAGELAVPGDDNPALRTHARIVLDMLNAAIQKAKIKDGA